MLGLRFFFFAPSLVTRGFLEIPCPLATVQSTAGGRGQHHVNHLSQHCGAALYPSEDAQRVTAVFLEFSEISLSLWEPNNSLTQKISSDLEKKPTSVLFLLQTDTSPSVNSTWKKREEIHFYSLWSRKMHKTNAVQPEADEIFPSVSHNTWICSGRWSHMTKHIAKPAVVLFTLLCILLSVCCCCYYTLLISDWVVSYDSIYTMKSKSEQTVRQRMTNGGNTKKSRSGGTVIMLPNGSFLGCRY